MTILKIIGLIFWLLFIPAAIGLVPIHYSKTINRKPGNSLLCGYVLTMALTELIGIPVELICYWNGYWVFMGIFGVALLALAFFGLKTEGRSLLSSFGSDNNILTFFKSLSLEAKVYFLLTVGLVIFQVVMMFFKASMDADDCYFNAQALNSQVSGALYRLDAYTGKSAPMDTRHAMAMFPIWEAFVSSLSGTHVTILNHKVLPVILIPLSYVLVYKIGGLLFKEKKESQLLFVLLINVWRIFGFVSYQTTETFFLLRTWQGKSVAGNLLLPMAVFVFLYMYENEEESRRLMKFILAALVLASGAASSLAVMLMCSLVVLLALLYFILKKDGRMLFTELLTVVPGVIYILIYLFAA